MYIDMTLIPHNFVPLKSFYFEKSGRYYFHVNVSNEFYTDLDVLDIDVVDFPCYPPKVSWDSAMGFSIGKYTKVNVFAPF